MCLLFLLSAALGVWTGSTQKAAFGSSLNSATWAWQNVGAGDEMLRGAEPGAARRRQLAAHSCANKFFPNSRTDLMPHSIIL